MLITDSIHIEAPSVPAALADTFSRVSTRPQTPYQVLRLLPKDATPAQQDSAIQAWFQPGEIHYSEQPDTLHLPGHGVGHSVKDVSLPQYYRESYFSGDTLYHPELEAGRYGVAGDPVTYNMSNDSLIISAVLLCFVASMLAFAVSRNFIIRQIRSIIYPPKTEESTNATSTEIKALLLFSIQTAFLLSLLYFFYVRTYVADTFILSDNYLLIAIYFATCLGYFILKPLAYTFANLPFFEGKKNGQWIISLLFLTAAEGILLYPAVLLLAYLNAAHEIISYYCLAVVILVKLLAFYKCYIIFFRQNALFLQIILYFCALEIVPLAALWGGLEVLTNALKINF